MQSEKTDRPEKSNHDPGEKRKDKKTAKVVEIEEINFTPIESPEKDNE